MREDISRVLEGQQATAQMPAIAADTTQVALPAAPTRPARALPAEEE